jgi:hypothetical protein
MENLSELYGLSEIIKNCRETEHKYLVLAKEKGDEKAYVYYCKRYVTLSECLNKILESEEEYPFSEFINEVL